MALKKPNVRLYHYWRSSCSWRVRWALAIKGIACEFVALDMLTGETEGEAHRARNPMGYVPTLELLDEKLKDEKNPARRFISESLAIIEWLEETYPEPRLLPASPLDRAHVRRLAELVNAGIQPIQNLSVLEHLSEDAGVRKLWSQHWIREGFKSYETLVRLTAGQYSFGDQVTMADLCLVPQVYNAHRFGVDMAEFPTIARIHSRALQTETCRAAMPETFQPDDQK